MHITPPDPIAFSIGPVTVYWYGILIGLAILLGANIALREAEKQGLNTEHFFNLILVILPAAFIGARLYYVIFNWDYYSHNPWEIPATWHGGLAIHGGIIGGLLGGLLLLRRYRLSFWQVADVVAPSLVLGQAIGRWGNFFNQEAYGYEVDPAELPWAMYIDGAYRHPTFLYESLWDLSIFVFLIWLRKRKGLRWGDVALSYVVLYSLGRYFIEGLRTDSLMLMGSLRVAQVVSILGVVGGLGILFYRHRQKCAVPANEECGVSAGEALLDDGGPGDEPVGEKISGDQTSGSESTDSGNSGNSEAAEETAETAGLAEAEKENKNTVD